jgi:hypothetical protein
LLGSVASGIVTVSLTDVLTGIVTDVLTGIVTGQFSDSTSFLDIQLQFRNQAGVKAAGFGLSGKNINTGNGHINVGAWHQMKNRQMIDTIYHAKHSRH